MDGIARDATAPTGWPGCSSAGWPTSTARRWARAPRPRRAPQADPVELPPGRYEVVLEPAAVADLLTNFALYGFNGKAVARAALFAELGAAQFDPAMTLVDDPLADAGLPFDAEGTPRTRLALVETGITAAVAHDRRTAAEAGAASTGHARRRAPAWGPMPQQPARARPPGERRQPTRSDDDLAVDASAGCWSPTSGTPGCSTRARWSSPG